MKTCLLVFSVNTAGASPVSVEAIPVTGLKGAQETLAIAAGGKLEDCEDIPAAAKAPEANDEPIFAFLTRQLRLLMEYASGQSGEAWHDLKSYVLPRLDLCALKTLLPLFFFYKLPTRPLTGTFANTFGNTFIVQQDDERRRGYNLTCLVRWCFLTGAASH